MPSPMVATPLMPHHFCADDVEPCPPDAQSRSGFYAITDLPDRSVVTLRYPARACASRLTTMVSWCSEINFRVATAPVSLLITRLARCNAQRLRQSVEYLLPFLAIAADYDDTRYADYISICQSSYAPHIGYISNSVASACQRNAAAHF